MYASGITCQCPYSACLRIFSRLTSLTDVSSSLYPEMKAKQDSPFSGSQKIFSRSLFRPLLIDLLFPVFHKNTLKAFFYICTYILCNPWWKHFYFFSDIAQKKELLSTLNHLAKYLIILLKIIVHFFLRNCDVLYVYNCVSVT